ncbi:MAG: hypothetical protein AAF937_06680 [Planctomycetota bacterium]
MTFTADKPLSLGFRISVSIVVFVGLVLIMPIGRLGGDSVSYRFLFQVGSNSTGGTVRIQLYDPAGFGRTQDVSVWVNGVRYELRRPSGSVIRRSSASQDDELSSSEKWDQDVASSVVASAQVSDDIASRDAVDALEIFVNRVLTDGAEADPEVSAFGAREIEISRTKRIYGPLPFFDAAAGLVLGIAFISGFWRKLRPAQAAPREPTP